MQEAAVRALGLKAFYLPFEVRPGEFRRLMRSLARLQLDGFNVTVPYKEEIIRYLDGLSPSARTIGAVNTVVRQGKRWIGFNTDETGFIASLEKDARFRVRGKKVLLLGAGGSARAVAYGLAQRGAGSIWVANRTPSRARKMISEYRRMFPRVEMGFIRIGKGDRSWLNLSKKRPVPFSQINLVVNATSVGLRPGDPSLVSPKDFSKRTLFFDLIYQPAETAFLRLARRSGHRTVNGMNMLIDQGAEAFRLWTGRSAPIKVMRQAVTNSKAAKQ